MTSLPDRHSATQSGTPEETGVSHTPGPWSYIVGKDGVGHIYGADYFKIHDFFNGTVHGLTSPTVEANARLIAAAPDLLAACQEVLRRWTFDSNQQHTHSWHDMQDCAAIIRAAIELAQGRAGEGR